MTFAYIGTGGLVSDAVSIDVPLPAGAEPGHVLVAFVDSGHPSTPTEPSTPDGWLLAGTVAGTTGVFGADAGPRRLSLYLRLMQAGDGDPTFTLSSGTNSRIGGAIFAWSYAAGQSVQWQVGFGEDTTSGTGFAVTTTAPLGLAAEDMVQLFYLAATDAATWSGQAVTAAGVTFGAVTEIVDSQSSVGADMSRSACRAQVTTGSATGTVNLSATLSAASYGVAGILRLRDTIPDGTSASVTITYDSTLARVRIGASNLSTDADAVRVERSTDGIVWTTVRGATAATVVGGVLPVTVDDYEFSDAVENFYRVTAYNAASGIPTDIRNVSITPDLIIGTWLKSVARPFLNTAVDVVFRNPASVTRPARTGVFDVVGRSYPVAVSDVRKSRRWTMYLRTETFDDAERIDLLLASGDVLFIQPPAGCPQDIIVGGFAVAGDATVEWHPLRPESRLWTLPMTEVAAPAADVTGAVGTYQTLLDTFASYTEVATAHTSYAELLALVGSPTEVIVP